VQEISHTIELVWCFGRITFHCFLVELKNNNVKHYEIGNQVFTKDLLHGTSKITIQNVNNFMPYGDANEVVNRGLVASSLKNMNCQVTRRLTYHQFTCMGLIQLNL
jgi:hypothetical protein